MPVAVEIHSLSAGWPGQLPLLSIESLVLPAGESLFLSGPSGCGKSTLLSIIAGVMQPHEGQLSVLDQTLNNLSSSRRDRFRGDHLGIIFQQFNLLPYLSVQGNVCLPCRFSSYRRQRAEQQDGSVEAQALRLLNRLGLGDPSLLKKPVRELSVGQQQRVAAARALMGAPGLVIADEPTSSLDADSRHEFIQLLIEQCQATGAALLFVSHDRALTRHFDHQLSLDAINRIAVEEADK